MLRETFLEAIVAIRSAFQRLGPAASAVVLLFCLFLFLNLIFDGLISPTAAWISRPAIVPVFPLLLCLLATALIIGAYIATNPSRSESFVASVKAFLLGDTAYSLGLPIPRVLILSLLPIAVFVTLPEAKVQQLEHPAQRATIVAESVNDSVWQIVEPSNVVLFQRGAGAVSPMNTSIKLQLSGDQVTVRWVLALADLERMGLLKNSQQPKWNPNDWRPEVHFVSETALGYRPRPPGIMRRANLCLVWDETHPSCQVAFDELHAFVFWKGKLPPALRRDLKQVLIAGRVLGPESTQGRTVEITSLWLPGGFSNLFHNWSSRSLWTLSLLYLFEILAMTLAASVFEETSAKSDGQ